jgi:hypothetical protein
MKQFFNRVPFHPFLWAIYPILSLLESNLGQVYLWMAVRSIVLSLLATSILLVLLRLIFRDWHKAALSTSALVLVFFSYGHIYPSIEDAGILNFNIGRHRYLILFLLLLLAALFVWLVRRKRGSLNGVTQAVNIVALVLVAIPLAQIGWYQINQASTGQETSGTAQNLSDVEGLSTLSLPAREASPDVYYIILDAYGREDVLQEYFGYDNQAFIAQLEVLGFKVANCSQSNYSVTEFSIASALNMNYLDKLGIDPRNTTEMEDSISHSTVRQAFESMGYQSVAFESGYGLTEIKDADSYFSLNLNPGLTNYLSGINAFEALLLRTSVGYLIYDRFETLPNYVKTMLNTAYAEHRTRILYNFDSVEQIAGEEGAKFVFVHILAPHNPFVFGADGQLVVRNTPFTLNHDPETEDPAEYARGYTNQLTYINQRTIELVESILASASTPPIIILQGDHGPMLQATSASARMKNLTAVYMPPGVSSSRQIYDSITPVNIFRLILDEAFNAKLGLVEDTSYFGSRSTPIDELTVIPNDCR